MVNEGIYASVADVIGHVVYGTVIQEVRTSNVAREVSIVHFVVLLMFDTVQIYKVCVAVLLGS